MECVQWSVFVRGFTLWVEWFLWGQKKRLLFNVGGSFRLWTTVFCAFLRLTGSWPECWRPNTGALTLRTRVLSPPHPTRMDALPCFACRCLRVLTCVSIACSAVWGRLARAGPFSAWPKHLYPGKGRKREQAAQWKALSSSQLSRNKATGSLHSAETPRGPPGCP